MLKSLSSIDPSVPQRLPLSLCPHMRIVGSSCLRSCKFTLPKCSDGSSLATGIPASSDGSPLAFGKSNFVLLELHFARGIRLEGLIHEAFVCGWRVGLEGT